MKISIVVPAYNESNRIAASLEKIVQFKNENKGLVHEIIVVDDGSVDNTAEIASKFDVQVIAHQKNKGKGFALRQGIKEAEGEYIYICDTDLSTPIEVLKKFVEYADTYDCVIGSRAAKGAKENASIFRIALGKFGNLIVNVFLDLDIGDTQCGFKLFNKEAADIFLEGEIDRWGFDFEFLYLLKKKDLTVKELPVKWIARGDSTFTFSGYFTTFSELFKIWWKYIGFSKEFFSSLYSRFKSFLVYLFVGTVTNLLNVIVFTLGIKLIPETQYELFGLNIKHYQIWDSINYLITIVFLNYYLHKTLTFKAQSKNKGEFLRYMIVLIINYFASLGILTFLIEALNFSNLIAKVVSILCVISWNFFVLKFFVYRKSNK